MSGGDGLLPDGGCALASLRGREDPVGTATPFDDVFLLQLSPPWARIALSTPGVPDGLKEALVPSVRAGRRPYVLLVDADDLAPPAPGVSRLVHVRRPPGPARRLERREYLVESGEVAAAIDVLAAGGRPAWAREETDLPEREMLVCTHGERDGCCGRFGEAAYRYLRDRHAGPDLRVWRVSHFGGHRFAPTLIDLPDGRCWGRLSEEALDALATRSAPPAALRSLYRGWCAVPGDVQAAERDLLVEHGWGWTDAELESEVVPGEGAFARTPVRDLALRYRLPGRTETVRRATLRPLPSVHVPASCGADEKEIVQYACEWHPEFAGVGAEGSS